MPTPRSPGPGGLTAAPVDGDDKANVGSRIGMESDGRRTVWYPQLGVERDDMVMR